MPEISKLSLNAGELSDELAGRIDLGKFNSGCEVLENARVLRVGGTTRRAGFKYVTNSNNASGKSRLVGFRFASGQGFALEFSALKMRVFTNGALVSDIGGDGVHHIDTLWTETQIFNLQFAQRIDRIVVTHPDVAVQNILKLTDGTWSVSAYPWLTRIWETFPSTSTLTLTASATSGTGINITSSGDLFGSVTGTGGDWVGDRIKLDHTVSEVSNDYRVDTSTTPFTEWSASTSIATTRRVYDLVDGAHNWYRVLNAYDSALTTDDPAGDRVSGQNGIAYYTTFFEQGVILVPETAVQAGWVFETFGTWDGTYWVQRSYDDGTTWSTIKVITSADNKNERVAETETQATLIRVVVARYHSSDRAHTVQFTVGSYVASGSAKITSVTSATVAVATVEDTFHSIATTTNWYEAAFSPRNGYPSGVTFYQSRLCFGGSGARPQSLWLSRTQKPFDFTFGTLATDAMNFQTDAEGYEAITWLSSHLSLLVGTTLGVWAISSPDGSSLTPESNNINRQMQLGAEPGFQAVPLQNNVLFLQYKGRKIQELTGGSVEYGGYLSSDVTQLAAHITRGGVTQMASGELPDSALYLVTGGEIAVLTYERAQNVVGWARWKTSGSFESIATTSGAEEDDDIYVVVNRDGERYIEYYTPDMLRIEENNDVASLRFLDSFTEASGSALTQVTGLTRFQSLEVDTFIDGEPYGLITVSASGVATLPHAGDNVVIGLPYTTEVRPMPIDFGAIGSKSAAIEVNIRFRNSLGGEVSQDRINWSKVQQLQPRIVTDTPLSLQSQDFQSTPHSTWGRQTSISVRQTQPLPMTILAMRIKTKSSR